MKQEIRLMSTTSCLFRSQSTIKSTKPPTWPPKTTTTRKPTTTQEELPTEDSNGMGMEGDLQGKPCTSRERYPPNTKDCSKYYRCVNSKWVSNQCAGGLMFDTTTTRCNWANIVNCGDRKGKIKYRLNETYAHIV